MKHFVIISDSFKGTLSSKEICNIFCDIVPQYYPDCHIDKIPISDGGEGFLDFYESYIHCRRIHTNITGPDFQKIESYYLLTDDNRAIIELAKCSGLNLTTLFDPSKTTTYGVGEQILHAIINYHVSSIIIGVGGSCTNDCGFGALCALGLKCYTKEGEMFTPVGYNMNLIDHYDTSILNQTLLDTNITIYSDVKNVMFGKNGSAHTFAKQKGADDKMIQLLDNNMRYVNNTFITYTGKDVSNIPSSGAAGSFNSSFFAFTNANIVSGIDYLLDTIHFKDMINKDTIVFTGEGKLDSQSRNGKVVSGVSKIAKSKGCTIIGICGCIENDEQSYIDLFDKVFALVKDTKNTSFETIRKNAKDNYIKALKESLLFIKNNIK